MANISSSRHPSPHFHHDASASCHTTGFNNLGKLQEAFAVEQKKILQAIQENHPPQEMFPLARSLMNLQRSRFEAQLQRSGGTVIGKDAPIDAISYRPKNSPKCEYPTWVTTTAPKRFTVSDGLTACISFVLTSASPDKKQRENTLYHSPIWASKTPDVIEEHTKSYREKKWSTEAVLYTGRIDKPILEEEAYQALLAQGRINPELREMYEKSPDVFKTTARIHANSVVSQNIVKINEHHQAIFETLKKEGIPIIEQFENVEKDAIFGCQSTEELDADGKPQIGLKVFHDGRFESAPADNWVPSH